MPPVLELDAVAAPASARSRKMLERRGHAFFMLRCLMFRPFLSEGDR